MTLDKDKKDVFEEQKREQEKDKELDTKDKSKDSDDKREQGVDKTKEELNDAFEQHQIQDLALQIQVSGIWLYALRRPYAEGALFLCDLR